MEEVKLLFLFVIIVFISLGAYFSLSKLIRRPKKSKFHWPALCITGIITLCLLTLVGFGIYTTTIQPDTQCSSSPQTRSAPPLTATTSTDAFLQGNSDYDLGNCQQAIGHYTQAIMLNPKYAEAYNNRAYTYMRLRNYAAALIDLNAALALNPNYIKALMNRGDIHNYYFEIDRQSAVADYEKVLSLGATGETSVCGHLILARDNGWNFKTFWDILTHFPPMNHC